jgi:hypothetical protein
MGGGKKSAYDIKSAMHSVVRKKNRETGDSTESYRESQVLQMSKFCENA